jgi:hypothetical protein
MLKIIGRGDARPGKVEVAKRDKRSLADHVSSYYAEASILVRLPIKPLTLQRKNDGYREVGQCSSICVGVILGCGLSDQEVHQIPARYRT